MSAGRPVPGSGDAFLAAFVRDSPAMHDTCRCGHPRHRHDLDRGACGVFCGCTVFAASPPTAGADAEGDRR